MEVLRIKLKQTSANYRKEESITNKMTYPLPPFSTIIGAIHSACNYKIYHPMDISVQGMYQSMTKEPYTDYCFLNSVMDDRGLLVKMKNRSALSTAYNKVAKSIKSQGNSFRNGITIDVYNESMLEEYRGLRKAMDCFGKIKKQMTEMNIENMQEFFQTIDFSDFDQVRGKIGNLLDSILEEMDEKQKSKLLKKGVKDILSNYEKENINDPYDQFATLTTSVKYYEVLNAIELIIHIKTDEITQQEILKNIYNLTAIGRSEDFVDIKEAKIVSVTENIDGDVTSKYSAYLDYELIKDEDILIRSRSGIDASGTKYYINKNYAAIDNKNPKRIFEKKKVIYASGYMVDEESKGVYLDKDGVETYIVNFL